MGIKKYPSNRKPVMAASNSRNDINYASNRLYDAWRILKDYVDAYADDIMDKGYNDRPQFDADFDIVNEAKDIIQYWAAVLYDKSQNMDNEE